MDRRLPPALAVEGARATVKWFNQRKGFGFVSLNDDNRDALLHASVLARAGMQEVREQDQIVCDIVETPRGLQVHAVHQVIPAAPGSGGGGAANAMHDTGDSEESLGTVKFFNAAKGFGFVHPDEDGRDIFISAHILSQCGVDTLDSDQRVKIRYRQGTKGPQAISVSLL